MSTTSSGAIIGQYRVLEPLGKGTIGQVFAAEGPDGRRVALKVLAPALQPHPSIVALFLAEAREVQKVPTGGILPVLDLSGSDGTSAYIVTELLLGASLEQWLETAGEARVSFDPLLFCLRLARTLLTAHRHGAVHGDLHPGNVFLVAAAGGTRPTLADFGASRVLGEARRAGAAVDEVRPQVLACRAPEQREDPARADEKTDVYALGAVLLRLLGARQQAPAEGTAPDLSAGRPVPELLHRMMAPDPAARPTMEEAAAELARLQPSATTPDGPAPPADASADTPPAGLSVEIGQCIGSYRLVGRIGQGGMGVVFDALHTRLSRRAAIKVLLPEFSQNPEMVSRFFTEAESANVVQHPGIISVLEFGQLPDRTVFIVMEYLDGETLQKRLERCGGRLGADAPRLFRQIASALAKAHAHGVVHRDLKPENVMIVADPDVPGGERTKIMDFGIAKMKVALQTTGIDLHVTRAGQVMGTPWYMSPEQFRDAGAVDDRADVYSLGVMLYQVLAGQLPFDARTFAEIAAAHMYLPPRPLHEVDPSLPAALGALAGRMLAKAPAERPTMAQVAEELDRLVAPASATSQTLPPPAPPARPFQGLGIHLSLGIAVALGVAGGAASYRYLRRPPAAPGAPAAPIAAAAPASDRGPGSRPANDGARWAAQLEALVPQALEVLKEGLRDPDPSMRKRTLGLLGQGRDLRLADLCTPLLGDEDPAVRMQAAAALRQLGARAAVPALLAASKERRTGEEVRLQLCRSLVQLGEARGEGPLRRALHGRDAELRERAALGLAERGDRKARDLLLGLPAPDEEEAAVLGRLARAGDRDAAQALRRALPAGAADERTLRVAEELARNDDAQARALLESTARREGPLRMRAARALAGLDDPSYCADFRRCLPDRACALTDRLLAAEGLGACGGTDATALLGGLLPRQEGRPLRLRLAAAGALLQLGATEPKLLAQLSLRALDGGMEDPSGVVRTAAVGALGEAEPPLAVPRLQKAIRDEDPAVRQSAARALGRTRARAAVPVLGAALDDSAGPVRREAMHSIGQVGRHLRGRGEPVDDFIGTVGDRAERGDERDRLVAVAALVNLGVESQKEQLRRWLHSRDAEIRLQAVEALGADPKADPKDLVEALGDRAAAVRRAAAAALAERGLRDGVPVLREALDTGGADAITARALLERLGEKVSGTPALGAGPPEERVAAVDASARLPSAEALALLKVAAQDIAAEVRMKVVEVLSDVPALLEQALGRRILRSLLADPEAAVRARAGLVAARLKIRQDSADEQPAPETAPAPAPPVPEAGVSPDLGRAAEERVQRGHLLIEAEDEVRFRVDRRPEQAAPVKLLSLSAGKHRLSYSGGSMEVEVPTGGTVTVRVPLTRGQQALADAAAAFEAGDGKRAAELLARAQRLLGKGRLGHGEAYNLLYYQGRVYESQGRWLDAMSEYEKLKRRVPDVERDAALKAAVARAAAHLGRIRVSEEADGKCQSTELWLDPGEHVLDIGGRSRTVRVRAGETQAVQTCK